MKENTKKFEDEILFLQKKISFLQSEKVHQ